MPLLPVDSYDKLYCKADGTGTSFVDSSTANPKTITANGGATQLAKKFNKSAGFFNGTSDYVVVPDSADWDFSGNFDVEIFVMLSSVSGSRYIIDRNGAFDLYYNGSAWKFISGSCELTYSTTPTINTWIHLRVQKSGTGSNQVILYVDNVQQATGTLATGISSSTALGIGSYGFGSGNFFSGWMKELRISDSTRTVAVPTAAYTSDSNTKLLMHFDTPADCPIGPAIYFDGTGDYLSLASHADFALNDFTAEAFINFSDVSGSKNIMSIGDSVGAGPACVLQITSGAFYGSIAMSGGINVSGGTPVANKWTHVAFTRASGACTLWIDGVSVGTGTKSNQLAQDVLWIGRDRNSNYYPTGSMREIRISNVARYSAAFTPSQSGFTVDSNTKLYIKGNEANGATTFVDSETSPKTVTTNGDTKIKWTEDYRSCIFKDDGNTGHKPYPVGSAKVDFFCIGDGAGYIPTGSWLSVPDDADWDMGAGNYSISCYVRMASIPTQPVFVDIGGYTSGISISYYSSDLYVYVANVAKQFAWTPVINTWYRIDLIRSSTSDLKAHINGSIIGSTLADANNYSGLTSGVGVGADIANLFGRTFNGRMDLIRIAKGVARYTATFDPPFEPAAAESSGNFFLMF